MVWHILFLPKHPIFKELFYLAAPSYLNAHTKHEEGKVAKALLKEFIKRVSNYGKNDLQHERSTSYMGMLFKSIQDAVIGSSELTDLPKTDASENKEEPQKKSTTISKQK